MMTFRFIHAADLHLDSPFRGMQGLPQTIRERVRESTFAALDKLVKLAIHERVDFVVISGDVYDLADRSLRAQIRFQKAMEALSGQGIQVFVIHGNHDPLDGRAAKLHWPSSVHIFGTRDYEPVAVDLQDRGVVAHVHGFSYGVAAVTENLATRYVIQDKSVYNIALLHTNVDGDASHDNYAPCRLQELVSSGFDYWALGHIHTRQILSEQPYVVYSGNLQGRSVKETGPKGCYIVNVDVSGGTSLSFHALDDVRWLNETVSIDGLETEQDLKDRLEGVAEQARESAGGRAVIVRLRLEGRGVAHGWLRRGNFLRDLLAELRDSETDRPDFVWIESAQDATGPVIDRDALLQQQSFLGDLLRLSDFMEENEAELEAFAAAALEPLHGHARLGKLLGGSGSREDQLRRLRAAQELVLGRLAGDGRWDG